MCPRYPHINLDLARRLEQAEGLANVAYVETRRELQPDLGAAWTRVEGALALFDGLRSPLTQTFGLGVVEPPSATGLARLEAFFARCGSSTAHEVSALAAPETWQLLSAWGYSPIETSVVLVRATLPALAIASARVTARQASELEIPTYSRVMLKGLSSEPPELVAAVETLVPVMAHSQGVHCFLAELDGQPIGAGLLVIQNGVALLGGASTIPTARKQGAQAALLRARLAHAATLSAELAMLVAAPGSASQRNAERQGFRPAYTRSKWQLAPTR